jgi:hypothetical protein
MPIICTPPDPTQLNLDHIQTISLIRLNPTAPDQSKALSKHHKQVQAFIHAYRTHSQKKCRSRIRYTITPHQRTTSDLTLQLHSSITHLIQLHSPFIYLHPAMTTTSQRTTNNTPRPQRPPILQLHQKPQSLSRPIQLPTTLMRSSKQTPSLTIIPPFPTFR